MVNQNSSTPAAIEFRHVSLSFDGKTVLDDVSFELGRGRMIALTGASGSGKSTLLHLAMGLLRPDEGQILIEGREIEQLDESELLAIRGGSMGMVFQEEALFSGQSVYDNAAFRLVEHGWSPEDAQRAVQEVLQFVGLEEDQEKFPAELSGGMKRRLEIARALIGWPTIMLYDEPTSGLDPLNSTHVLDLVIRARDIHQISSLYVTKKLYEIPYLAIHVASKDEAGAVVIGETGLSRSAPKMTVMLLNEGRVVFTGSHEEFVQSELPAITYMTRAENGTEIVDYDVADPWDKRRKPREGMF